MAVKPLPNETELLAKIAAGDQYAFTVLFNYYQRDVFVLGKRITHSEDEAVEIVQDIFIKIWTQRDKLSQVDNFGGYLNRIVRNHALDVLKHHARKASAHLTLQQESTELEDVTVRELDYKDALGILDEALETLAPQQKMAYQLCHMEGLKYEEAARQMNISTETVRAHMKQALRKIREHFSKHAILYPMLVLALCK